MRIVYIGFKNRQKVVFISLKKHQKVDYLRRYYLLKIFPENLACTRLFFIKIDFLSMIFIYRLKSFIWEVIFWEKNLPSQSKKEPVKIKKKITVPINGPALSPTKIIFCLGQAINWATNLFFKHALENYCSSKS